MLSHNPDWIIVIATALAWLGGGLWAIDNLFRRIIGKPSLEAKIRQIDSDFQKWQQEVKDLVKAASDRSSKVSGEIIEKLEEHQARQEHILAAQDRAKEDREDYRQSIAAVNIRIDGILTDFRAIGERRKNSYD